MTRFCMILILVLFGSSIAAAELRIAVASNFKPTLQQLVKVFQASQPADDPVDVRISAASTGKLYAQISHGAPYDLFLAADPLRPRRLVEAGLTLDGKRTTYALGQLALWIPGATANEDARSLIDRGLPLPLAIANPKTAPYGVAARQFLQATGHWQHLQGDLVRGENIGQTYNYVASGAAGSGLVALSQLADRPGGLVWVVPPDLYQPVVQQMVLLTGSAGNPTARSFARFMLSGAARKIIRKSGYQVSGDVGS